MGKYPPANANGLVGQIWLMNYLWGRLT